MEGGAMKIIIEYWVANSESLRITVLQGVATTVPQNVWFPRDGTPSYFSIPVRNHCHATSPRRWIRRGGPVALPPLSLDLYHLDFFFWGHMKSIVFETSVTTVEDITAKIVVTSADTSLEVIQLFFHRRGRFCCDLRSRNFD
ncbi:uncharacterized protein TNCV_3541021 [Trichonephila clavipes]|nr:uncharacterized protein TNCV_3541021 [Trichonephila clavipes]